MKEDGWIIRPKSLEDVAKHLVVEGAKVNISLKSIELHDLMVKFDGDCEALFYRNKTLQDIPKFAFIICSNPKSYRIREHLERRGLVFLNPLESVKISKCKAENLRLFKALGIPYPKSFLTCPELNPDLIDSELKFPVVVKNPNTDGGDHVFLCQAPYDLIDKLDNLKKKTKSSEYLIQEYIENSHGRDFRVIMLGNEPIVHVERHSQNDDFRSNISTGGSYVPAKLPEELKEYSRKIVTALNSDFVSIDFLFDQDGYKACEINTLPGMIKSEEATGIKIAQKLLIYLKEKAERFS